jgi:exodeoxyribonuclease VII large subunit
MTVCDAVADLRAATPSAAAAAACASRDEVKKALSLAGRDLHDAVNRGFRNARRDLESHARRITQSSMRIVSSRKGVLGTVAARLNALSPLATLSRGYAVARDQRGRALTSARQFYTGLEFSVQLHDGRISATTEEVVVDENSGEGRPLTQKQRDASA